MRRCSRTRSGACEGRSGAPWLRARDGQAHSVLLALCAVSACMHTVGLLEDALNAGNTAHVGWGDPGLTKPLNSIHHTPAVWIQHCRSDAVLT